MVQERLKMKELTEGTIVLISENLKCSVTERRFNLNPYMLKMQGCLYPIHSFNKNFNTVRIYYPDTQTIYTFDPSDVIIPQQGPEFDSILFDVTNVNLL